MKKLKDLNYRESWNNIWANYSVGVIFFFIFTLSIVVKGKHFLTLNNIINILRNNSIIGIIALGMTFIIASGGIDLSVGSQLVATGTIIILILESLSGLVPPLVCIALALLGGLTMGISLGFVNGLLITQGRIPPFIVTLGTMNVFRSVSQHFMGGGGFTTQNTDYIGIANYKLFGVIPLPILYFVALTVIMHVVSKHTRFGRFVYATGSNEKATKLSGINVNRVKLFTYALMGFLVALAAIVETSRMGSINPTSSANYYEMDAIAAAVIGGASMSGGKGLIVGTFFGVLTIGLINNMMTLVGVPPFLVSAMKGTIIVLAVLLQKKETEQ